MSKIRNGMIGALGFALMVLPNAALADFVPTPEQRSACMGDAMRLCSTVLYSGDRVVACLLSKKSQLSPRCRAVADKG